MTTEDLAATRALREMGATVDTLVCAIDRSEPGSDPLGLEVRAVLTKQMLDLSSSADAQGR